jgi:hypothetical protein
MHIFFYCLIGVIYLVVGHLLYNSKIKRYYHLKKCNISAVAKVIEVKLDPNTENYDVLVTLSFTTQHKQLITEEYYAAFPTPMVKNKHISPEEFHEQYPTMNVLYNPEVPDLFMVADDITMVKKETRKIAFMTLIALAILTIYLMVLINYITSNVNAK